MSVRFCRLASQIFWPNLILLFPKSNTTGHHKDTEAKGSRVMRRFTLASGIFMLATPISLQFQRQPELS